MVRLEDVLAELSALPGVRAAALAGFDGLFVDEALGDGAVDGGMAAEGTPVDGGMAVDGVPADGAPVAGVASDGAVDGGMAVGDDGPEPVDGPSARAPSLDGAVVELTHAWNAARRACAEYLDAGAADELVMTAERGLVVSRTVGSAWFALVWAGPDADVDALRAALRGAAGRLDAVVS